MILSIESSCDDSSIALTKIQTCELIFHTKISQDAAHSEFGGVVPEIASRLHAQNLPKILQRLKDFLDSENLSFKDIQAIAVTNRPGLSVTLSEGVCMANALALTLKKPIIYVNHLLGHIFSLFINKREIFQNLGVLLVSGGHTQILKFSSFECVQICANTLDDSFGESFDKTAKMLALGYPGGPIVEKMAKQFSSVQDSENPLDSQIHFPIALLHDKRLAFSFSGLKNAVRLEIQAQKSRGFVNASQICYFFQKAAVAHLLKKLERFFLQRGSEFETFGVVGGASANKFLRQKLEELCARFDKRLIVAPLEFCSDNAAMIGRLAVESFKRAQFDKISDLISPSSFENDFQKFEQ